MRPAPPPHTGRPLRSLRAITAAVMTLALVVWIAKALALYHVPTLHLRPLFWIRLMLDAVVLSGKEIALAGAIGLAGAGAVTLVQNAAARAVTVAVVAFVLVAMALINIANIEILRLFGAPLTVGLVYYSDVLGSETGLTDVLSWMPAHVTAALAASVAVTMLVAAACALVSRRMGVYFLGGAVFVGLLLSYGPMRLHPPVGEAYGASGSAAFVRSLRQLAELDLSAAAASPPSSALGADLPAVPIAHPPPGDGPVRNVVVVILESVAAQYLDLYGGPFRVTPGLTGLAGEALVVRNAYSHAVATHISLVSILSSTFPWVSMRTITNDAPGADLTILPAVLRRHGFRTAFFNSTDTRHSGADQFLARAGFDLVQDYRHRTCDDGTLVDVTEFYSQATTDACTFRSMREWIASDLGRPFLAVLWTYQQHYPYFRTGAGADHHASPDLAGGDWSIEHKARYLDAIAEADAQIRGLVEDLRAKGLLDDTLIVVTGDHGEAFRQHGTLGHGYGLYEEDVHVPLVLINSRLFPVRSTDRLTGHADIAPSILDALGFPLPPEWQGRSLFRPKPDEPIFFFSAWLDYMVGYRAGTRKVVARLLSGEAEAYDLAADPGERTNLLAADPSAAAAETARIIAWVRDQNRLVRARISSGVAPSPSQ
jgi:lipoteichoic acid synthase